MVGTVGRLAFLQVIGDVFSGPIDTVLGWVGEYRIPLLAISITLVLLSTAGELRRGRKDLADLHELEEAGELGAHGAAVADEHPGPEGATAEGEPPDRGGDGHLTPGASDE